MTNVLCTFVRQTVTDLRSALHRADAVRAAAGGYAAALAIWMLQHGSALDEFLLKNVLPLEGRRDLAVFLAVGSAVGLSLWWLAGWRSCRQAAVADLAPTLIARGLFALTILPFWPALRIEKIETQYPFLCFGLIAAMAVLTYRIVADLNLCLTRFPGLRVWWPGRLTRAGLTVVTLLTLAYILVMSVVSILRHNNFMTHAFDLGLQDQVVYNILHTGRMVTTLLGPGEERVYDHFSPLFYFVAPIYASFQGARVLLVLQSLFLGIGALPLYLLTQRKTGNAALAGALTVSYLLYPALHGINLGDFHQIAFVSGLLLFALYFLEEGRNHLFLVTLTLALFAKEEVALSVAAIGVYILLSKRRPRLGLALTLFGMVYFVGVVGWLMPRLGSVESAEWRYAAFILPDKGLLQSFVLNFVTNPLYPLVYVASNGDKLVYLGQLFLPVLFLPVIAAPAVWIAALPALLLPLLTVPQADYGIRFHYSAHITPFIFFLAALALQKINLRRVKPLALAASLIVASGAMSYEYGQVFSKQGSPFPRENPRAAIIRRFLTEIPSQVSVSTLSDLVPHLSARKRIYLFPVIADADYLLVDSDVEANFWPRSGIKARSEAIRDMLAVIGSQQFGLVRQQDGVLLLKRGYSPAGNAEAMRALLTVRYEAEKLAGGIGATVTDLQASGAMARVVMSGAAHAEGWTMLAYGPYTDLPPGKYRAAYALKTDRVGQWEQVAMIDVFTHKDGGIPRAAREIGGTEFAVTGRYQLFELEFETDKPLDDVEFRVQYAGQGMLGLDYVQITPVELWLK